MKAAFLYGKRDIRVREVPVPRINEEEVLIRVKRAAICGTDVRMYQNGARNLDEDHPLIIGHELAGVIEEVGGRVTHYRKGMRVTVAPNMGCGLCNDCIRGRDHMCKNYRALGISLDGGFAEYMRVPAAAVRSGNIVELSDRLSFSEAAIAEALSCVLNGCQQCDIRPGDWVLIIGAGPIGIMHGMLAKMCGATKIFINDISESRLEECKRIDPSFITVHDDLEAFIRRETGQSGVNVVITACPVPAVQQEALELAANFGRVCFFGGLPEEKKMVPLNANAIHYKQLSVTGTTRASLAQFKKVVEFLESGILNVSGLITREIPLEEIRRGFEYACASDGLKNVISME